METSYPEEFVDALAYSLASDPEALEMVEAAQEILGLKEQDPSGPLSK